MMKILVLIVRILNFVIYFPCNGDQQIQNQTNQYLPASLPDSSSENQISFLRKTKENGTLTEDIDSYSAPTERIIGLSELLGDLPTLQAPIDNHLQLGNYAPSDISASPPSASLAYLMSTIGNATEAEAPKSNATAFSAGAHRIPPAVTAYDAKSKMGIEKPTGNFWNGATPRISIILPETVRSSNFRENSETSLASDSEVSLDPLGQSTDSINEAITLSTSDSSVQEAAGSDPGTDFAVNKGYTLHSVAKASTLTPSDQNNKVQTFLLMKDDSLMKLPNHFVENSYLTADNTEKWETGEVLADPWNSPLASTFLKADFISPNNHNVIASVGNRTMIMMINRDTRLKGGPTVAISSVPTRTASILKPKTTFRTLRDIKNANEEQPAPYREAISIVEGNADFHLEENLHPASKLQFFQPGHSVFERGVVITDTSESPSQLSESLSVVEETISGRDLINLGEENTDALYDVIYLENDDKRFKSIATKALLNGFDESAAGKENMGAAGGTAFLSSSRSMPQTGRMHNLVSTMPRPAKRLANKFRIPETEITNILPGITTAADHISDVNEDTEVIKDLVSITATTPIQNEILIMSSNEPNTPRYILASSGEDPNVSGDDGSILMADFPTFTESDASFNHPLRTKSVKKVSLEDIIIPISFHNKNPPATQTVPTASQGDHYTMLHRPGSDAETHLKEDIVLNYEAEVPQMIGIMAGGKDRLQEDDLQDGTYVTAAAGDNIPKGNKATGEQYYMNADAQDFTRLKGTTQTTSDQTKAGNPTPSQRSEASKSLLENSASTFQGKRILGNRTSGGDHSIVIGGDISYPNVNQNVPGRYVFIPKREYTRTTPYFRRQMKGNVNPSLEDTVILGKGTLKQTYVSHSDKQNDPEAKTDQITTDSVENYHAGNGLNTVTAFTTISSEDVRVKKPPRVSKVRIPLTRTYVNTPRDDSFRSRLGASRPYENKLSDMNLIITEPDKSGSEYISNKYDSETEENIVIKKSTQSAYEPNELIFHSPSSDTEVPKRLPYRITHPELETKVNYQTTFLQEENPDSGTVATVFENYTQNSSTQHPRNTASSLIGKGETFPPEFPGKLSVRKDPLSTYDATFLSEASDFRNENIKYPLATDTETVVTIPENRIFRAESTGHAVISTPVRSQGHFGIKDIPLNTYKTTGPELADIILSGISKDNISRGGTRNIINKKRDGVYVEEDYVTKYEALPFTEDFTLDSDFFLAEENIPNKVDIMTFGADDSMLKPAPEINALYGEEAKNPTKAPALTRRLHKLGSPAPFSPARVTGHLSNENPVELNTEKYRILTSKERKPNSDEDNLLLKYFTAKFHTEAPRSVTRFTQGHSPKASPGLPSESALKSGTLSKNSILISPEGKEIGHVFAHNLQPLATMEENRGFPSEIVDLTVSASHQLDSSAEPTKYPSGDSPTKTTPTELQQQEAHSTPQLLQKALPNRKLSPNSIYEERDTVSLSDQEAPTVKFELNRFKNEAVLSPATDKMLPSNIPSMRHDTVEEEVYISEVDNFPPKDISAFKDNSFFVNFDVNAAEPETHPNLKDIPLVDPTLTFPDASRPRDQRSTSPEVNRDRITINVPTGFHVLPGKPDHPDFTAFTSSSNYLKRNPVTEIKKDSTTRIGNNISLRERNHPFSKITSSPTTITSTNGMKKFNDHNRFLYNTFTDNGISSEYEIISFTENISEEAHDPIFTNRRVFDNENVVIGTLVDDPLDYDANHNAGRLSKGTRPPVEKASLISDANVFRSRVPYPSAEVTEHLFQGSTDVKTSKQHQGLNHQAQNPNSHPYATALQSPTVNFDIKPPRFTMNPQTEKSWNFPPEFTKERTLKEHPLPGGNSVITVPEGKRPKAWSAPDTEPMSTMEATEIIKDDPIDPTVITTLTDNMSQFNRKEIPSAFYSNASPGRLRVTAPKLGTDNKHKINLMEMLPSRSRITSLPEVKVIPDDDFPLTIKDIEDAHNMDSIFWPSENKVTSTVAEFIDLSTEGGSKGGYSIWPAKGNINSKGFPFLPSPSRHIPDVLIENVETSSLMRDNPLSEYSIIELEELKGAAYDSDALREGSAPERETITIQTGIQATPLATTVPQSGSTTSSENPPDAGIYSFSPRISDIPAYYTINNAKMYSKLQSLMKKAFLPGTDSQKTVFEKRNRGHLSPQKDPAARVELNRFTNAAAVTVPLEKTLPSAAESNILSKSDNAEEEEILISDTGYTSTREESAFFVKPDTTSAKMEASPNSKGIYPGYSTFTLVEASRPNEQYPAFQNKVANKGVAITNTPIGSYGALWKSALPLYFTASTGIPKYSELVPVMNMGKDGTKKVDNSILPKGTVSPSDKFIILPMTFSSDKDRASTLKQNVLGHTSFRKSETAAESDTANFTGDISEWMDGNKITPKYTDYVTTMFDDNNFEYVSNGYAFESDEKSIDPLLSINMLAHAPKAQSSHAPFTVGATSDSLENAVPSGFKSTTNDHISRRKNKKIDTEVIALGDPTVSFNTKTHKPTPDFLTHTSDTFPPTYPAKMSMGESTANVDYDTILFSDISSFGNKKPEHFVIPAREPIVESRMFKPDMVKHVTNRDNYYRKDISPTIYETSTASEADTATSSIPNLLMMKLK